MTETLRRAAAERDEKISLTVKTNRSYEPFEPEAVAERDAATAATTLLLAERGVRIFRVHNVLRNAVALKLADALVLQNDGDSRR